MIDLATETLLTIEKAAERLLVSKATLHSWMAHGTLLSSIMRHNTSLAGTSKDAQLHLIRSKEKVNEWFIHPIAVIISGAALGAFALSILTTVLLFVLWIVFFRDVNPAQWQFIFGVTFPGARYSAA